eukprot:440515_1
MISSDSERPGGISPNNLVGRTVSVPDERSKSKSPSQIDAQLLPKNNHNLTEYTLEGKPSRLSPKQFLYLCTSCACLSSILLGYDIGIMSGAIVYMEHDLGLSQWRKEIIISSLNLFSILGCLLGGHISQVIGRRKTIVISAIVFFIGALLIAATKIYGVIVFGRILLGIASGIGLVIAPLYTAELSPPDIRGKLVTFAEIAINGGILFGYFIAWMFVGLHNDDAAWRIMISFGTVPAIILFVGVLIMPESPRWLIEQGMENKAYNVLRSVYGNDDNMIINEINDIKSTIQLEMDKARHDDGSSKCGGWLDILWPHNAYVKRALLIGVGIAFFQQASGNEAAVYYTPHIFARAGVQDNLILLYTTFVGIAKVSFIFVAMFLLDRVGRRPLLFVSAGCMTFSIFGLAVAFGVDSYVLIIIFQCCFTGSFSIGWGPITWVIVSEIFPLHVRSKSMAVCSAVNRLISGLVALTFLSLQDALSPVGTWIMFGIISALSIVFIARFVPETKQKTLEQITKFLMRNYKDNTASHIDRVQLHDIQ